MGFVQSPKQWLFGVSRHKPGRTATTLLRASCLMVPAGQGAYESGAGVQPWYSGELKVPTDMSTMLPGDKGMKGLL